MVKEITARKKLIKKHGISGKNTTFELTIQNTISTVTLKEQWHLNNILFLLVPLLLIILEETSALPPIIKIGKYC